MGAAEVGRIAASYGGLDVIACNAGVMAVPDTRTGDGFETQMQTNHLSHFLLVDLLLPSLEAAATSRGESRVVTFLWSSQGRACTGQDRDVAGAVLCGVQSRNARRQRNAGML